MIFIPGITFLEVYTLVLKSSLVLPARFCSAFCEERISIHQSFSAVFEVRAKPRPSGSSEHQGQFSNEKAPRQRWDTCVRGAALEKGRWPSSTLKRRPGCSEQNTRCEKERCGWQETVSNGRGGWEEEGLGAAVVFSIQTALWHSKSSWI